MRRLETTSHALVQERVRACEFDRRRFHHQRRPRSSRLSLDVWRNTSPKPSQRPGRELSADKGVEKTRWLNATRQHERLARRPIARRCAYGLTTAADLAPLDLNVTGAGLAGPQEDPLARPTSRFTCPRGSTSTRALRAGLCLSMVVLWDRVGTGLAGFEGVRGRLEPVDLGHTSAFSSTWRSPRRAGQRPVRAATFHHARSPHRRVPGHRADSDHDPPGRAGPRRSSPTSSSPTDDPLVLDPVRSPATCQKGAEARRPARLRIVIDRRAAIRRAIERAKPFDFVLLAGKGHERTMSHASGSDREERPSPRGGDQGVGSRLR